MATVPSNLNFPTSKQVPDHAILDYFNKQCYLGNAFGINTGLISLNTSSETPLLYLSNPTTSGKSVFCNSLSVFQGTTTGVTVGRAYLNPTVTSNGNVLSIVNERPAMTNSTSVASAFSAPIIAAGTPQVSTITTVADVAGSLNNKYFYIYGLSPSTGSLDSYYVWFNVNSAGTDPQVPFKLGVEVDIATGATANAVATALATAIATTSDINAPAPGANIVTTTNVAAGAVPHVVDSASATKTNFTFATTIQGSNNFGTLVATTCSSLSPGHLNRLIILDPGNSLLVTGMCNSNQPVGISVDEYEL